MITDSIALRFSVDTNKIPISTEVILNVKTAFFFISKMIDRIQESNLNHRKIRNEKK